MTEVSARYTRLAGAFTGTVAAVRPEQWPTPSSCEGWTVHEVVRHVVDSHGMFLGFVGRSLPEDLPDIVEDPLGAWSAARDTVQADLDDPERAGAGFDGFFGRSTFERAVDRFLCFDLVVHRWDIAHATGQDDRLDPADVMDVRSAAEAFGDALRSPGAFGPALEPPDGADDQTRLLAFLGRRAW